jgi:hypothetical protein
MEMETRRWVSRNSRWVKYRELAGGKDYNVTRQEILALTVQIASFTCCLDGMDGPDGQNPTLNNQPMSAEPGRIKREEGRGAIIIFELRLRGSIPQAAEHKNLGVFRMDDHHGEVGI